MSDPLTRCVRCGREIEGVIVCAHDEAPPYNGALCWPCAWGFSYGAAIDGGTFPRPRWVGDPLPHDDAALGVCWRRGAEIAEKFRRGRRH